MKRSVLFILVLLSGFLGGCGNTNTYLLSKKGEAKPHQYNLVDLHDSTLEMLPAREDKSTAYLPKDVVAISFDSVAYFRGPLRRSVINTIGTGLVVSVISWGLLTPVELFLFFHPSLGSDGGRPISPYWIPTSIISSVLVGYFIASSAPDPWAEIDLRNRDHLEYMRENSIRAKEEKLPPHR